MFSGKRAAHLHAKLHDIRAGGPGTLELIGIAMVKKNQRMQIAVSSVKNVSDDEAVTFGNFFDAQERRRELGARNDAIEHVIRWRDAANGAEGLFAAFPKQSAFASVARAAHFSRMVAQANLADFGGLGFGGLAHAFHLYQKNGGTIERQASMDIGFDGAESPAIEHFASCGNHSASSDIHDAVGGIFERVVYGQKRAHIFRQPQKSNSDFRDQRESSLRADHEAGEIIAGRLHAPAAELHNFAIRQDQLEAGDMVGSNTVGERMRPAGIFRDIAANGAGLLAGRIGSEIQAELLG